MHWQGPAVILPAPLGRHVAIAFHFTRILSVCRIRRIRPQGNRVLGYGMIKGIFWLRERIPWRFHRLPQFKRILPG